MGAPRDKEGDRGKGERDNREPAEGHPVRKERGEGKEDERVDREAAETFPASDPPANY
jgi:hypothetical protein